LVRTEIRPARQITAIIVSRERGDCVVAGEDERAVVGGSAGTDVAGTVVRTGVGAATTLNVFTPTKPFVSVNVTS
jgi:hypothetical protein